MKKLLLKDFDFHLPYELIAQKPKDRRSDSRLLALNKENGYIEHENFEHIVERLSKGDVLVRNNTKVRPVRIYGAKDSGACLEMLLVRKINDRLFEALIKPLRRVKCGDKIRVTDDAYFEAISVSDGKATVALQGDYDIDSLLSKVGKTPLPKYIKTSEVSIDKYQTVYARHGWSAAAPTAGLHFTEELFDKLRKKGVVIVDLNLNVGLGTFAPVRVDDLNKHKMHTESFDIPPVTADIVNRAKTQGNKIISLGTTTLRALESATKSGLLQYGHFETDIFIRPGYEFRMVDALITNFHLPKSTLLVLVSAFAGKKFIDKAYKEAVEKKYKFFSFGDAMYIY